MTRHVEDQEIRRYLLGDLPEQEETAVEAAYFGDAALLERIETAANDLADEYAAGRMAAADRVRFERRLLASTEGREDVAFARALQAAHKVDESRDSGATRLPLWLGWAAIAVMVVGAALLAWQLWSAAERIARDTPSVATVPPTTTSAAPVTPSQPGSPAPATPETPATRIATLALTGDLARSEGQPPTLLATPGITHVDLLLPASDVGHPPMQGRVETVEGKPIWSGPVEPSNDFDTRYRARIPAATLPPGDYLLVLSGRGGAGYYFRVRSK